VANTIREFIEIFRYLARNPQYGGVVHLVNPTHIERAKLLHNMILPVRASFGFSGVTYEFNETSDFLSTPQAAVLANSAEQALFNKREKQAMKLASQPNIMRIVDALPDFIKRIGEDITTRNLLRATN
jgi:hypothetical protein